MASDSISGNRILDFLEASLKLNFEPQVMIYSYLDIGKMDISGDVSDDQS